MRKVVIVSGIVFLLLFTGIVQATQLGHAYWAHVGGWHLDLYTNMDPRINFYTENGYSLNSELCQGQKFKVTTATPSSEWIVEGEYDGSPPVTWVNNITAFEEKVLMIKQLEHSNPYNPELLIENISNTYLDNGTGIPVYYPLYGNLFVNVVCELPKFKTLSVSGVEQLPGNIYEVKETDNINISFNTESNCVYYFICACPFTPNNYFPCVDSNQPSFSGRAMLADSLVGSGEKSITITKTPSQPKIQFASILTDVQVPSKSSTYLKITINNTGEKEVDIKDINLNVNSQFLACTSTNLEPGESTECILYVSPDDSSLVKADVKYQYIMCGERQTKTESFPAGFIDVKPAECLKNADCLGNYICCSGKCYDSAKGICSDVNADGVNEWVGK
jgi:hypothetical protein